MKFGRNFVLQPTPNWSGTVRVEYAKAFPKITSTAQELDLENSWHEWVVLDCCVKVCAKEESDPSVYMAQQQKVLERMAAVTKMEADIDLIPKAGSTVSTLAGMRREIRNRGKWSNNEITMSMLTSWINASIDSLEDFVIGINPMDSSVLTLSDVTVTAGTGTYDLPSDLHTLLGVAVADGTTDDGYTVLEQYRWDERYADGYGNAGIPSACRWSKFGDQLRLQPIPSWSGTIRLEYAGSSTTLSGPSDTFSFNNSWVEWVVLDVCVKCCARVGADPSVFMKQQETIQQRIQLALKAEDDYTQLPKSTSGSITLQDLRRSVRGRGNWARNDVTDNQLTQWVNASIKSLLDVMVIGDSQAFDTLADVSIVSGTKAYDIPTDLYRLLSVAMRNTSAVDGYTVLSRYNLDERYDNIFAVSSKYDTRYMLIGNKIEFQPTPNFSETCRLSYVAHPTALSAPSDTYDFKNGWEEFVILDCCAKVAMLRGENPQGWIALRDETTARILKIATRDISKPRTVVDYARRQPRNRFWRWYG
jgi:hypothetical protein